VGVQFHAEQTPPMTCYWYTPQPRGAKVLVFQMEIN